MTTRNQRIVRNALTIMQGGIADPQNRELVGFNKGYETAIEILRDMGEEAETEQFRTAFAIAVHVLKALKGKDQ
jgi:hypothetical protein